MKQAFSQHSLVALPPVPQGIGQSPLAASATGQGYTLLTTTIPLRHRLSTPAISQTYRSTFSDTSASLFSYVQMTKRRLPGFAWMCFYMCGIQALLDYQHSLKTISGNAHNSYRSLVRCVCMGARMSENMAHYSTNHHCTQKHTLSALPSTQKHTLSTLSTMQLSPTSPLMLNQPLHTH